VLFSYVLGGKEKQDGNSTKSSYETYARTRDCDLAGMHYIFIEKIGPFQDTAGQAWQELHKLVPGISEHNKLRDNMSLYKVGPKLYRAGVSLAAEPKNLPEKLTYEKFKGGKYSRFVLSGSYSNLPEASGRVFEIVAEKKIQVRNDFCIENYANDPRTTPRIS